MRLSTYDKLNVIAAYHFVVGGLYLLLAAAVVVLPVSALLLQTSAFLERLPGWFLGVGLLGLGGLIAMAAVINLVLGWGLWQLKPWSRMATMLVAVLRMLLIPVGTAAGGAILYVMLQDRTRELFQSSR